VKSSVIDPPIVHCQTEHIAARRKNVRNLMIFKLNSYQAELKLCAKFCGYRTENYRDLDGRFKGALAAARLSDIESLCDSYNFETLP
jgi:hypothetical protein